MIVFNIYDFEDDCHIYVNVYIKQMKIMSLLILVKKQNKIIYLTNCIYAV